jgi:hypothetical protein
VWIFKGEILGNEDAGQTAGAKTAK